MSVEPPLAPLPFWDVLETAPDEFRSSAEVKDETPVVVVISVEILVESDPASVIEVAVELSFGARELEELCKSLVLLVVVGVPEDELAVRVPGWGVEGFAGVLSGGGEEGVGGGEGV